MWHVCRLNLVFEHSTEISLLKHQGAAYRPRPGAGVVLMTATLSPPAAAIARSDPQVRLRDYCEALKFHMRLPSSQFDRIVLADNSASDLTPILHSAMREQSDKAIELLSFQANDHPPSMGKAYGEFRLLDTALAHSQLSGHGIGSGRRLDASDASTWTVWIRQLSEMWIWRATCTTCRL